MTTPLMVKVDKEEKEAFAYICKKEGLSASEAIKMFIKVTLQKEEIPFKIKADPFYSDNNKKLLLESKKQMDERKKLTKECEKTK